MVILAPREPQHAIVIFAPFGIALGAWLVFGAAAELWTRAGRGEIGAKVRRVSNLPRADWGKVVAHAGLGITMFGIAAMTAWQQEDIRVAQTGERWDVGQFSFTLESPNNFKQDNTIELQLPFIKYFFKEQLILSHSCKNKTC